MIILLTGLSGAGKTTISTNIKHRLAMAGLEIEVIDGDDYREEISRDLSFSKQDRIENIRRLGFIASKFSLRGIIPVISAICPYEEVRQELASRYKNLKVVHIDCPIPELIERDTKGLYRRALLPAGHVDKIHNLTGINDNYEAPVHPDLYVNTYSNNLQTCIYTLSMFIAEHYFREKYRFIESLAQHLVNA